MVQGHPCTRKMYETQIRDAVYKGIHVQGKMYEIQIRDLHKYCDDI